MRGVGEDDLRDDSYRAVHGAEESDARPFPGPRAVKDGVDDVFLGIGQELKGLGVVDEGCFDQSQEVEVSGAAVQDFILGSFVEDFGAVIAETGCHIGIFGARRADGEDAQDVVADAAVAYSWTGVGGDVVLSLLEVDGAPGPEGMAGNLQFGVDLLQDEEGVRDGDGASE